MSRLKDAKRRMEAARKAPRPPDWPRIIRHLAFRYKYSFGQIGQLTLGQVACLMAPDDDGGGVMVGSRAEVESIIAHLNME